MGRPFSPQLQQTLRVHKERVQTWIPQGLRYRKHRGQQWINGTSS